MHKKIATTFVTLALAGATAPAQERMGGVSGRVRYADGTPVAGATIGYLRLAPLNLSAAAKRATATGADGSFALSGMAAGSYQICVQGGADAGWIDPCVWAAEPAAIHLLPGQTLTGQTVTVEKAATLEVRVNDPNGVVTANERQRADARLELGVWTTRQLFLRAAAGTATGAVRPFRIPVPQGRAFRVGALPNALQLRGDGGAALQDGVIRASHTVPPGTARSTLDVTVAGISPPAR